MSENAIYYKGLATLVLFGFLVGTTSCDPCRELAEQICNCREASIEQRRQCINDLNIPSQYQYFKEAKKPEICEAALKKCSCAELIDDQAGLCGRYRLTTDK